MRRRYNVRKTISMKHFISEFGHDFSEHMKERLMELEIRCVLTRKKEYHRLEIKHVEHIQYDFNTDDGTGTCKKEYAYGQLVAVEGGLYFSDVPNEDAGVVQSPIVSTIYNALSSEGMIQDHDSYVKKVDDSNIDFVIDSILTEMPNVTQRYLDIISRY